MCRWAISTASVCVFRRYTTPSPFALCQQNAPSSGLLRLVPTQDFWREAHIKSGYELLYTPHMASIDLWKTSGHFDFYKEGMFDQMEVCDTSSAPAMRTTTSLLLHGLTQAPPQLDATALPAWMGNRPLPTVGVRLAPISPCPPRRRRTGGRS
eukprot:scaffold226857_cov27-Tisochrysis_lutea.AAC.4